jgi:hypothetical protein
MQPLRGRKPGRHLDLNGSRTSSCCIQKRVLDLTRQPPRNGPDASRNTGSVREDRLLERITRTYQEVFADAHALIEDGIEEARKLTQSSRGELQRAAAQIGQLDKKLASMTGLLVDPDAAGEAQRYIDAAPTRTVSQRAACSTMRAGSPATSTSRPSERCPARWGNSKRSGSSFSRPWPSWSTTPTTTPAGWSQRSAKPSRKLRNRWRLSPHE